MSNPNTITIPADLWGILRDLREVRTYQASLLECGGEHVAGASLLRHLADEIERQALRPEGWYSIRSNSTTWQRVLWWTGAAWFYGPDVATGLPMTEYEERDSTITPVTIGDPS